MEDVTEKMKLDKLAKRERDISRTIFENAEMFIVILDDHAKILDINSFTLKSTGYARDEVVGKNWLEIFLSKELKNEIKELIKNIKTNGFPVTYENNILRKDKTKIEVLWNNKILYNDDSTIYAIIATGLDVTEMKMLKENCKK